MKKKIIAFISLMLASLLVFSAGSIIVRAEENEDLLPINARSYLLMDFDSGTEIMSNNKDKRLQIASMVKIMTLDIIFDTIESGNLNLDDNINISENAASMGGSQAFLDANSQYKAEELIKSIIIASANDSCVAMAEHIAGSVESFVYKMNEKAKQLGMNNTNFVNCTGLPAPNEYSCAEDVAKMSLDMMKHKRFFDYSGIWMYDLVHPSGRVTGLTNTNKLSRFYKGCDGGKTGFTSEALSCLSATAKRDGLRLLCVVIGAPSSKERNAEVTKLFNYGFANYSNKKIIGMDDAENITANVISGKTDKVKVKPARELFAFGKKSQQDSDYKTNYVVNNLTAPVKSGDIAGYIEVIKDGEVMDSVELIACENVEKMNFIDYVKKIAEMW